MFVILVTYKKSLEEIEKHIPEHIRFLDEGYKNNYFIVSGRRNPRIGGVIISQLDDRKIIEDFMKKEPFYIRKIADHEIIEFAAGQHHPDFEPFLKK